MNLNQIKSFIAITKTLNFTAAARQLGIPQSTISRQINDLEAQLNVRLFYRTKRDVHLTDEGRTFLPFAREMAEAADKGTQAVQKLHDGGTGHLSIAVVPASEGFLCRILDLFHQKYPDIVVDLDRIPAGYTLMEDVNTTHDFWFLYSDMISDGDEYESMTTHNEPIGIGLGSSLLESFTGSSVAAVSDGKLPKEASSALMDKLPDSDIIMLTEESDPILYMQAMNYCRTRRFKPRIVNNFSDPASLILALASGIGVSFLPGSMIKGNETGSVAFGQKSSVAFVPLEDDSYSIPCVAAWKKSLLNPAASLFLETMKGAL